MSVPRGAVHAKWIVGKVIGTKMQKTAKVRVTRLVLDPYLLKVTPSVTSVLCGGLLCGWDAEKFW